ncbi:hypothetical protein Golomagni_08153 [Golovinomyces magnicellulatus]|nr:hypothetical protein Golomagni_08153 [Golovinomyces magnicellulatus]
MESYVTREEDAVIAKLQAALKPCVGVDDQLEKLAASGKYHMAVVSSSALRRVKASIEKVGQDKYFRGDEVFSAATSLPKPTSKPDPAIYLHALEKLGRKAENSVAIEDSKSEMEKTLTEAGAVVVMRDWSEFPQCLAKIEAGEV